MYADILVSTDASPGAEVALEHAVGFAERYDAVLHAVYVQNIRDVGEQSEDVEGDVEGELTEQSKAAFELVRTAASDADLEVVEEVRSGTPHEEIVSYATDAGVDLVVMGTHAKSGLSRVLLGSTAESVVHAAPMPVLTVRSEETTTDAAYGDLLLPVDDADAAELVAGDGVDVATAYGATIHAMYVDDESPLSEVTPFETGDDDGRAATGPIIDAANGAGVPVEEVYDRGTPHEEVLRYAEETAIDMIVLPTDEKGNIEQVVASGSAEEIIRRSPVPVLSVNRPAHER